MSRPEGNPFKKREVVLGLASAAVILTGVACTFPKDVSPSPTKPPVKETHAPKSDKASPDFKDRTIPTPPAEPQIPTPLPQRRETVWAANPGDGGKIVPTTIYGMQASIFGVSLALCLSFFVVSYKRLRILYRFNNCGVY